jgi:choline kinase
MNTPATAEPLTALLLVAGRGRRLWNYSRGPKCLIPIQGVPLIHRYLDALGTLGPRLARISAVVGYETAAIRACVSRHPLGHLVQYVTNDRFELGSILSLRAGLGDGGSPTLLMDGDVYFEPLVLDRLLAAPGDNVFLIDTRSTNTGEEIMLGANAGRVVRVGRGMHGHFDAYGEWIGFLKMDATASRILAQSATARINAGVTGTGYEDLLDGLALAVPFSTCLADGLRWVEIDFPEDVATAVRLSSADAPALR